MGTANLLYALRQQRSVVEFVTCYDIIKLKNHKSYPGRLINIVKNQQLNHLIKHRSVSMSTPKAATHYETFENSCF